MRASSSVQILKENRSKKNQLERQKDLEVLNEKKQAQIDSLKKAEKLRLEEQELLDNHITFLEEKKRKLIEDIKCTNNPVVVSFSADEAIAGYKYVELKQRVENTRKSMLEARANILNNWYIWFTKIAATLFFIFVLIRLAGENKDLIASFTYVYIFQLFLGESDMALFLDFFIQDIPLVTAISFLIAVSFKDYDSFFEKRIKTKLYILFISSLIGLFISSMLFAY